MFNASGEQMDVTSPVRPEKGGVFQQTQSNANTLPAFLLGADSHYQEANNKPTNALFNNTPLKGGAAGSDEAKKGGGRNFGLTDIENRPPPTLLFSSKYGQAQQKLNSNRPFSSSQPAKKLPSGPPIASLGEGFRHFNTEPAQTKANSSHQHPYVMASSPLPEKSGGLPSRIQTPDFSSSNIENSPISTSPIVKSATTHQQQGTPLSRQLLEKRMAKQQQQQQLVTDASEYGNTSFPPEEEIDCWVSLFGFNSRNKEKIIKYLTACGSIVCRQPSKRQTANWIHLRFASPSQAKRARQRFNCHVLESECAAIAVVECLEPAYILDYIKGCGATDNVTFHEASMHAANMNNCSKVGMRSLIAEPAQHQMSDDPFNLPQQESNSVVRRTLTYLLPNYFQ